MALIARWLYYYGDHKAKFNCNHKSKLGLAISDIGRQKVFILEENEIADVCSSFMGFFSGGE